MTPAPVVVSMLRVPEMATVLVPVRSVMLMAFPHLFPPSSNQWKPNADLDPGTDTFASPDVWSKFPDFYQRAAGASKTAYDMSRADKIDDFKTHARELRIICDTCHALYSENQ